MIPSWYVMLITIPLMVYSFWRNYKQHATLLRAVLEFLACVLFIWLASDPPGVIHNWMGEVASIINAMVGVTLASGLGSLAGKYIKT